MSRRPLCYPAVRDTASRSGDTAAKVALSLLHSVLLVFRILSARPALRCEACVRVLFESMKQKDHPSSSKPSRASWSARAPSHDFTNVP